MTQRIVAVVAWSSPLGRRELAETTRAVCPLGGGGRVIPPQSGAAAANVIDEVRVRVEDGPP